MITIKELNKMKPTKSLLAIILVERIRGRFFDPKAALRAEDRRRTPRELKWMEYTVKQKNKE